MTDTFRITFASNSDSIFKHTLSNDLIMYTQQSNMGIHIGIKGTCNIISLTTNKTKISGDLQIMGSIYDSSNQIYQLGNNQEPPSNNNTTTGSGSNLVLSLNPNIQSPEITGSITLVPGYDIGTELQITALNVVDGAITNVKLANDSVSSLKMQSNCVQHHHISDGAISTNQLTDDAITTNKLLNNAVTTAKIRDLSISTNKLINMCVTTSKLDIDAVTTSRILDYNITNSKLKTNCITQDKIADDQIITRHILANSITQEKLAPSIFDNITTNSDDRIKADESFIQDATFSISKLRPQIYKKYSNLKYTSNDPYIVESGLIAQEVFYDAPELRHLVHIPFDANRDALYNSNITSSQDPSIDPDYKDWGTKTASLNYIGLISYIVKSIQEMNERINQIEKKI